MKSAGILGDAFKFALDNPGAKCAIFRERLDAVKQSFLDKLPSLFPQYVNGYQMYEYKEKSTSFYPSRCIIFPNGSYITLQRCADYKEAKSFQGWEFSYLAIDEVTKQEERTVDYLLTCVRSSLIRNPNTGEEYHVPVKVVLSCNPGGPGHAWIKKRFIDRCVTQYNENGTPVKTKDIVEFVKKQNSEETIKRYIRFIPASWRDNPFLNDAYLANLDSLSDWQKKQDLDGNWDVVAGAFFEFKDDAIISVEDVDNKLRAAGDYLEVVASIDWGYKPGYYSCHWYALLPDETVICFQELYGQELVFEDFVQEICNMSVGYNVIATCLPHDMYRHGDNYKDDVGRVIGVTKSDVFDAYGLNPIGVESGHGKVQMRYDKIMSACSHVLPNGEYKFQISEECTNLIEELQQAVHDDNNPLNIASKCRDHALDDYGLFLVYYADDYNPTIPAPVKQEEKLSFLQRILKRDEEELEEQENLCIQIYDYD